MGRLAITIGIRLLEAIFAVGILGSALVIILAGYEDMKEVATKDKEK